MLLEKGGSTQVRGMYGSCSQGSETSRFSGRLKPNLLLSVLVLAVITILAIACFRVSGLGAGQVSLLGMPISLSPADTQAKASRFQSLVGFNKQSDFPFAAQPDGEMPEEEPLATNQLGMSDATSPEDLPTDAVKSKPLPMLEHSKMKVADRKVSQQLAPLTQDEEPKADDSPIGLASAASILKDSEMLGKSQGSDAWDSWKAAVKEAGPSIKDSITDDVTAYNPFPRQSLSEKLEVQDVWDHAQALAKPAGSLDGDAEETKDTVENAEAQANAAAYLAANEAAATDAYDVSIPNPDMMAKGKAKGLSHQALAVHKRAVPALAARAGGETLAARTRGVGALAGKARAAPRREGQELRETRVQALAEVSGVSGAEARALADAAAARGRIQQEKLRMAEQMGAEQEAERLAGALEKQYGVRVARGAESGARRAGAEGARRAMQEALQAAKAARARAEVEGEEEKGGKKEGAKRRARAAAEEEEGEGAQAARLEGLLREEALLRERKRLLRKQQALRQQQLEGAEEGAEGAEEGAEPAGAEGEEGAGGEEEGAGGEGEEAGVFDVSRGAGDQRVHKNDNFISDMLGMALGDEKRPMEDVKADVHGASMPPMNLKHRGVTYNNGLNGGHDPLDYLGSYDTRTAAEIYQKHKAPYKWPPHWVFFKSGTLKSDAPAEAPAAQEPAEEAA